ncbi:LytR/AlgR family response regulator transcription factor [Aureivirga sp. CE67]|uniref:LytR/AlgR family response regulator transcription factor n=1 Tax=Aureivirga sp. CE67 TaxID=1788983 RepID=UPI0018CAF2E5|nr:response regulator transcription factor [Aureivirga sp. CE67]
MAEINVLIIEDSEEQAQKLKTVLKKNKYNVIGIANNLQHALKLFYELSVDIVVIDVYLGENPDGITFAETISIVPNSIKPFVFLTSSKDRSIFERAKLTKPFSFLLKPFNELEVLYALEMALEKFYEQQNVFQSENENTIISNEFLFIKKKNVLHKVSLKSIIYIEVENRYCNIITEQESFLIQISLGKMKELLDDKKFFQTHRKFIVNNDAIQKICLQDNLILLKNNHKVILSGKHKDIIKKFQILK